MPMRPNNAPASWSAAVLCRFGLKTMEDGKGKRHGSVALQDAGALASPIRGGSRCQP